MPATTLALANGDSVINIVEAGTLKGEEILLSTFQSLEAVLLFSNGNARVGTDP